MDYRTSQRTKRSSSAYVVTNLCGTCRNERSCEFLTAALMNGLPVNGDCQDYEQIKTRKANGIPRRTNRTK